METIKGALKIFKNHPIFLLPLFITWVFIACGIIYFKWFFNWETYNYTGQFIFAYLFYYLASLTILISCSILVELIEQDEKGAKISMSNAINQTFNNNIGHIIIIAFFWSIIWFLLVLLKIFFSKKDQNKDDEISAENIAKLLARNDSFSWLNFTFDTLIQALRMIVFIIVPSFAWENRSLYSSFKRGVFIVGKRSSNFIKGFIVSAGVQLIVYLPISILFYIKSKSEIEINDIVWFICILYSGFAWSFTIYVEQLFGAELFLWQLNYEKRVKKSIKEGLEIPKFKEIERPKLLDEIKDLRN